MGIVRISNKKKSYTQIDNSVLTDGRITYQALGVLTCLLSRPEKWKVRIANLVREELNGETEIYRILEELQLAGYVTKQIGRNAEGRITCTDYTVYEKPQTVDPAEAAVLTRRREERRRKKRANNRSRAAQPHVAEPQMAKPDEAEPIPRKDRVYSKERVEKAEPSIPCQGKGGPDSFSDGAEEAVNGKEAAPICPDTPEDDAAEEYTEDPAASRPEVAAGAAPLGVLGTSDPGFPHKGPRPDWCQWVRQYDLENARRVSALFPRCPDLTSDPETARMYYKRRYTGVMTTRGVEVLVRFYPDCYLSPEEGHPRTLRELLDKTKLGRVLAACREEVKQAIVDIRTDGETDDGLMHVLQRLAAASQAVKPETDMVEFLSFYLDRLAPLWAGFTGGAQRLPEAIALYRGEALEEIAKWPHWLVHRTEHEDYPRAFGFTYEEARAAADRFAADKAAGIAELQKLLT